MSIGQRFCLLPVMLIAIVGLAQQEFKLTASVKGYEGKTKIIINEILAAHEADMLNEHVLYMIDGRFEFSGRVEGPTQFSIRIRPDNIPEDNPVRGEQTSVFIENNSMTLTGEKGNFRYAHVTGSAVQDQYEELLNFVKAKTRGNIDLENEYRLEFATQHPDYFVSVSAFSWFIKWMPMMVPKRKAIEFYNRLDDNLQTSYYGQQIKYYIDNITVFPQLTANERLHEFSLPDSLGNYISLKSLKGKIVLTDFWFSGCRGCRLENKHFQELYQRYRGKNFEILSVSRDKNKSSWVKGMQADNVTWKSVWDADSKVTTNMYLVTEFPTTYLADASGKIIAKNLRGEALEAKLAELFGKQ